MMREPWFWRSKTKTARIIAAALSPFAFIYDTAQKLRWRQSTPFKAAIPVICVGNATLGGVGKTPFAMLVHDLLKQAGVNAWFLTRGYGGSESGPVVIDPGLDSADKTGDEALLLAQKGQTIVSRDRVAGAKAAILAGAEAIIMDDGFQNPSLIKSLSILLINAADPSGNNRIFPAGPLREPLERAKARADMVINIGGNRKEAQSVHHEGEVYAWLEPESGPPAQTVVAFSGIGATARFFSSLEATGFDIKEKYSFPDHHPFSSAELKSLRRTASENKAALITTEKDFVRLPTDFRDNVLTFPVIMRVSDPEALTKRLLALIDASKQSR